MAFSSPYSAYSSLPDLLEHRASSTPESVAVRVHAEFIRGETLR